MVSNIPVPTGAVRHMLDVARFTFRKIPMLAVVALGLGACGDGAPSKDDITAALQAETRSWYWSVDDSACTKIGNAEFDCRLLVSNSTVGVNKGPQGVRMSKLGGSWRITDLHR